MTLSKSDVAHLLRRTGFNASVPQIEAHLTKTRAELVDFVFDFTPNAALPALDLSSYVGVDEYGGNQIFIRWWMNRMATAPAPLEERLALFWHNHFATSFAKVFRCKGMADQIALFRALGTGDLNTLVKAASVDPAMLVWLDNGYNRAGSPNENFGRELLELFMLGEGQGYFEADVKAMSRAWTGHAVAYDQVTTQYSYVFKPTWHDTTAKTLFGVTAAWDGPQAVDAMIVDGGALNVVRNRVAKFVAVKLWSWFAAPQPDAALADKLGALLAQDKNMNIGVFLRKMFNLDEFFSPEVRTGLVRHPIDWLVSQMRITGFNNYSALEGTFRQLSMEPTLPPNVAGWKSNKVWYSEAEFFTRTSVATQLLNKVTPATPTGTNFLMSMEAATPQGALQIALDAYGEDRIVPGSKSWAALLALIVEERASGKSKERFNVGRGIALTPEFTLA